jgi:hypothetical protein
MLAALLNVPSRPEEWQEWSWHHRLSHSAILGAASSQKNIELTDYVIDPINLNYMTDWLERNQQMHVDMDQLVGAQAIDLTDVNLQDPRQLQSWVYLHYLDHQTVEQRLGIGS